jgi:hypothetical protein
MEAMPPEAVAYFRYKIEVVCCIFAKNILRNEDFRFSKDPPISHNYYVKTVC